jgi:predicted nucleotidyltransferase
MIRGVLEVPPDQQRYLDRLLLTLRDQLGPELIGVYLHGSLAMGAFTPGRSDVDALAVCTTRLSTERSTELGEALAAIPTPASGGDLEFTLIAQGAVRAPSEAPTFRCM